MGVSVIDVCDGSVCGACGRGGATAHLAIVTATNRNSASGAGESNPATLSRLLRVGHRSRALTTDLYVEMRVLVQLSRCEGGNVPMAGRE